MRKILFAVLFLCFILRVDAIEDIKINEEKLSPYFDNQFKKYNYFTNSDYINIYVKPSKEESVSGDGNFKLENNVQKFIITSSLYGEYEINVYKNYKKEEGELGKLLNLEIANYNIIFDENTYEYDLVINDEDMLDITYETDNLSSYVDIKGNGNFNKSKNIIEINVDNINTYKINVLKTNIVSKEENIKEEKTIILSETKKEIAKLIIITISCSIVFILFYILFLKK